jgi:hypothetical protein
MVCLDNLILLFNKDKTQNFDFFEGKIREEAQVLSLPSVNFKVKAIGRLNQSKSLSDE